MDEGRTCCRGKTSIPTSPALSAPASTSPPPQTGEVNTIFDREMNLAYLGEKSVKDATDTMKKEIDVALNKPL